VAPLKSSAIFLADLSRHLPIPHALDFLELAAYAQDSTQSSGIRLLKDLDTAVVGRHVLIVEDVVDTGLTLNFLARTLRLREPASLSAVTLLDRPYRRLVDDVPLDYVGFTVPDELFAGYGLGLDERWRALPDLHVVATAELPGHLTGDAYRAA
jgi:hypoxanthine phosphoribosyltransferase